MSVPRITFAPLALIGVLTLAIAACSGGAAPSASSPAVPSVEPTMSASPDGSPESSPSEDAGESSVEIVGVEYAFENVPSSPEVGTTFSFRNGGDEVHEMVVVRRNEGVEQSFEELLAMPEEEVMDLVTFVEPVLIAEPGAEADGELTLDEAGDYLMICFIPQGMRELPEGSFDPSAVPPGPPHFTAGMLAEFSISE